MNIKAIIFDWARTLYDVESEKEFEDAEDVLVYCKSKNYHLGLVSLIDKEESIIDTTIESRNKQIGNSSLKNYFEKILTTEGNKDLIIEEMIKYFGFPNNEILIVDDRTIRGIKYGDKHGCQTAWLQKGIFQNQLPNNETGDPTYVIKSLSELKGII